jgi:hypothetical protein
VYVSPPGGGEGGEHARHNVGQFGHARRLPNQKSNQELKQILVDECHDVGQFGRARGLPNQKSNQELEQNLVDKATMLGSLASQEAPKRKV